MNKKTPPFSIITVTLNSERFLETNINSVRNQTFSDYEHIFIDGYSKDKTPEIIRSYKSKNTDKVKVYKFPAKGVSDAFNHGIKMSRGKWLIFLNSDDYFYDKNVLSGVHGFIKKNKDIDWLYGKIRVIDPDGKKMGDFPNRRIFQFSSGFLLKFLNYIPHQAVFMKRNLYDTYGGFDESLSSSMDYDIYLRMAGKTRWRFFDRIISNYRISKDSVSSSPKNRARNFNNNLTVQKKYLNLVELPLAMAADRIIERYNRIYEKLKDSN